MLVSSLTSQQRGWLDVLVGHQKFTAQIDWPLKTKTNHRYFFGVTRGEIHMFPGVCGLSSTLSKPVGETRNVYERMAEEQHDTRLLYRAINKALQAGGHDYYIYQGSNYAICPASSLLK